MCRRNSNRGGFTRVELALTLCCAVLTAGVAIAAVAKGKESENRARCQDNLRQIGAGLLQYHQAHAIFPPALINCGGTQLGRATASFYPDQPFKVYNHTGFMLLLPFIGQEALYAKY